MVKQFKDIPAHTIADFPENRKSIIDALANAEKLG